MAYISVTEWRPEQVTEWLKGVDNSIVPYLHWFSNNEVDGQQLLNLSPDELTHLGVLKLGHQEIILEAVQHLRNFVSEILNLSNAIKYMCVIFFFLFQF